jgi:gas vesicle protein
LGCVSPFGEVQSTRSAAEILEAEMSKQDGTGNGAFVAGFILGAIGGAVAALFTTPKRGDELRHDLESRVSETTAPVRQKAAPLVNQGRERATEFVDKAADRAQEISGKIAAMDLPFDDDRSDHAPADAVDAAGAYPKSQTPASS